MSLGPAVLCWIAGFAVLGLIVSSSLAVIFHRRLRRTMEQRRSSDSRYRTVVEQAADGILLVDAQNGELLEANPSMLRTLGYSAAEIVRLKIGDILAEPLDDADVAAFVGMTNTRTHPRTLKQRCRDGQLRDVEVTVSHLEFDGRRTLCYIAHDVTERRNIELELMRNQRRLEHLAHHDSLTGLPNRLLLRTHLEQALQSCCNEDGLAVMYLDLDDFKVLNDSRGHNVGDELLVEVARKLKQYVGSRGMVARLGGDEFVVVLYGVMDQSAVASDAEAMRVMLTTPVRVAGRIMSTSVSIGITLSPQDARDLDTVLSNADVAMYKAKDAGRNNVQFFKAGMNSQIRHRLALEHALRRARESKQLMAPDNSGRVCPSFPTQ